MIKPRSVRKNEFNKLLRLVNTCFPADAKRGGMAERWPHCYWKKKLDNNIVIEKNNRIVSHVGYIPQELIMDNIEMKTAGISSVSTLPKYRRQGLMRTLLNYCIEKMKKEKVILSYLGGDRQRYNNFGWENAGRLWSFNITPRSFKLNDRKPKSKTKKYSGDEKDLSIIKSIHEKEQFRIKRENELYKRLMNRKGIEVYLTKEFENNHAYIVITKDDKKVLNITEFGSSGNGDGIIDILWYIFRNNSKLERINVFSPHYHRMNRTFIEIGSNWTSISIWMVKIINLKSLMKKLIYQIRSKSACHKLKGEVELEIKGSGQKVSIFLSNDCVEINNNPSRNKLCLTEIEMVRLLFGQNLSPSQGFMLNRKLWFLDNIFPLDFHVWHNDGV